MRFHVKVTNKKTWTFLSIFMASALIFVSLVISNSVFAQPYSINKISKESKDEKCASGALPPPACKNFANRGQGNNGGGISTGQSAGGSGSSSNGGDGRGPATAVGSNGTGEAGAHSGSNTANPAISQNQQSSQSCASGNIKLLPHSSLTCNNTANLGQTNNDGGGGGISTGQATGGGTTNP